MNNLHLHKSADLLDAVKEIKVALREVALLPTARQPFANMLFHLARQAFVESGGSARLAMTALRKAATVAKKREATNAKND